MIGNKRPIDNHFDASSSYPHPKRIRKNIYPLLPQGLPAEKRSFVSRASDYLGGFFASLTQFSANATQGESLLAALLALVVDVLTPLQHHHTGKHAE